MPRDVARDPSDDPSAALRALVDEELRHALDDARTELEGLDATSGALVDELRRLLDAGGSRLRPLACVWGFRAGGGAVGPAIVRAAAALELLHEMALIHDDVMDDAKERRGVASTHRAFAERAAEAGDPDPERAGLALAVLAGDLAAVLADRLLLASGFPPARLLPALDRYHRTRTEMAVGQFLDLTGAAGPPARLAHLKGGAYSVVGPLVLGATLAGAADEVVATLRAFGEPLGQAFQLADDLRDGEAPPGVGIDDVRALVDRAVAALDGPPRLPADADDALRGLADGVRP